MCNRFDISVREVEDNTMSKKLRFLVGLTVLVALILAPALYGGQDEPVLKWHTYAGSFGEDFGAAIAVDPSGNIYLAGWSDETWGSPINPHSGDRDVYVAKLNSTGGLEWNTFMGSSYYDHAEEIAMDGSGNVYVVGWSEATWGIPGEPFPSGGPGAFVAKLNSNGELQWHRFMTQYGNLWGLAAAVDANGYVYVGGWGTLLWETPPSVFAGGSFVAKLDSSGVEMWHAFLLETGPFGVRALAVDVSGNTYPAGWSEATWGNPIDPYSGGQDGFVAKLNNTGGLEWNTFIGSSGEDCISGIDLDESGNVYLVGGVESSGPYAAKLGSSGIQKWQQTFTELIHPWDIFVDGGQKVYVTGVGARHPGLIVELNRDGVLQWKTGLEAILESIALDRSGNVYVAGQIPYTWGTPVNPWAGDWDAFIAKMSTQQTYVFSGFDRPVDNQPIVNNAKAGSTIPVKWQITDLDGTPISDPASFESLTSYSISCGSFTYNPIEEVEEQSPGSSGLMYLGDGYWQFNWKTAKSYAGQCRIMVLNLADGSEHTAYFKFK